MHVYTTGKQIDTIAEEVKSCDYSVFGLTSERTENNTVHTVMAGGGTTVDQSYAATETKSDGINLLTKIKSCTQRTITDDKSTQITYEEAESCTNGLSTSGREYIFKSFQSEDLYQYSTFVRTTNRDGSSKWESSQVTFRPEDLYFFVENIYPAENGPDIIHNDELHRYIQC
ncbi:hypothetical protein HOLleu_17488 [Holothuria leucospilota]|uniref:Uncharacterized protein n=1 Tax=Holothuria leucospilota TaxID=206669 RepID=A0A9Q1C2D0_HOLLE|nr:hypothetical protein HOLleu_17488 [Holothuria leucospilota]